MEALTAKGYVLTSLVYETPSCSVYKASHPGCSNCPGTVAVKVQKYVSPVLFNLSHREVANMSAMQDLSHVVRLFEYFHESMPDGSFMLILVMEWVERDLMKDLQHRKSSNYPWPESDLRSIATDLIATLAEAERRGIVHRDIKPQNIFLDPISKTVKLGDFGSSKAGSPFESMATLVGTPAFMCGELKEAMLSNESRLVHNSVKSDVFSFGLTLLTIAKMELPLWAIQVQNYADNLREELRRLRYSEGLRELIGDMMHPDPMKRPTFQELEAKYCVAHRIDPNPPRKTASCAEPGLERAVPSTEASHIETYPGMPKNNTNMCNFCRETILEGSMPVMLTCAQNDINAFCDQTCLRKFVEQVTENYSKPTVRCPICPNAIDERDIAKALGGNDEFIRRKVEVTEKELFCVCCKAREATMVIQCGHIYCEECIDVYKTGLLGEKGMICSECQRQTSERPEKMREKSMWDWIPRLCTS